MTLTLNPKLVRTAKRAHAFRDTLLTVRARKWASVASDCFVPTEGDRASMVARLSGCAVKMERDFRAWESDGDGERFADRLLRLCAEADDRIWHRDAPPLRSYVDISVQTRILRMTSERLSQLARQTLTPQAIIEVVLQHRPTDRRALLAHAELLVESGHLDGALDEVRRALRVQAVCPTAQEMLFTVYRAMREAGSTGPELDALDYDLSDTFCPIPFTHLSTGWKGDTFACVCPSWVPYPIGNIHEAHSAEDVWNSRAAVEIRRSILDRDYRYCSRTQCPYLSARKLPKRSEVEDPMFRSYIDNNTTVLTEAPRVVEVNHDATCNLACPSCRTEIMTANKSEQATLAQTAERVLLPLLKRVEGYAYISGGGEPFSSPHYRDLLARLNRRDYPQLTVYLVTNGQLLTPKRWTCLPDLPEMISILSVSVDAARAETYERLRPPGRWTTLMANLEYISELRRSGTIPCFQLNFVVQHDNFREMLEFAELGERLGVDALWFQRLVNYGTYDEATFEALDVGSPRHGDHEELLTILRDPALQKPSVNMNLLRDLLPEFVESNEPFVVSR